jgi:hypothetical protein
MGQAQSEFKRGLHDPKDDDEGDAKKPADS